jgi:hypothetical protein
VDPEGILLDPQQCLRVAGSLRSESCELGSISAVQTVVAEKNFEVLKKKKLTAMRTNPRGYVR